MTMALQSAAEDPAQVRTQCSPANKKAAGTKVALLLKANSHASHHAVAYLLLSRLRGTVGSVHGCAFKLIESDLDDACCCTCIVGCSDTRCTRVAELKRSAYKYVELLST